MPPRPERAQALFIVALTLLVAQLLLVLASATQEDPVLRLSLHAALTEVVILGVALAGARVARPGSRHALGLQPGRLRGRDVAVLAVGTLAASHALDGIARLSGASDDSVLRELPRILAGAEGLRLLAAVVTIGLAPAVAEELLCRGLIQRALVRRLGPWPGILGASAVFGALHIDPVHAAFAGVLGLYLGVAARWDDSSRAAIVCHAVNNTTGVLALTAAGGASATASPVSVAAGGALALVCLRIASRSARVDAPALPAGPASAAPSPTAPRLQPRPGSDDP